MLKKRRKLRKHLQNREKCYTFANVKENRKRARGILAERVLSLIATINISAAHAACPPPICVGGGLKAGTGLLQMAADQRPSQAHCQRHHP